MKIKPSILEDFLVGFNALIRNKLEMMVKEILFHLALLMLKVYSFTGNKGLIKENKVLVDRSSMIHSFTCVTILYNH